MTDYENMPFEEWRRRIMERGREIHLANGSRIITASTPIVSYLDSPRITAEEELEEDIGDFNPRYEDTFDRSRILGITEPRRHLRRRDPTLFEPEFVEQIDESWEEYIPFSVRNKDLIEKIEKDKLIKRGYMK